jgi:nicotinamide mononucleotide adenylyltransferase
MEHLVECGEPNSPVKNRLSANLSTTNPTCPDLRLNPVRRGGKPAINRLTYATAKLTTWLTASGFPYRPDVPLAVQWDRQHVKDSSLYVSPNRAKSHVNTENHSHVTYRPVFYEVTPCSLVEVSKRLERTSWLHLQGRKIALKITKINGVTFQKRLIFRAVLDSFLLRLRSVRQGYIVLDWVVKDLVRWRTFSLDS